MEITKTKPKNFYKNEFYVEFNINGYIDGRFTSKQKLAQFKKLSWMKIITTKQLKFDNLLNDYFYKEI